jgi:hypothetical protein
MDRERLMIEQLAAADPATGAELATRMAALENDPLAFAQHDDAEIFDVVIAALRQEFETREKILRQHLRQVEQQVSALTEQLSVLSKK